jgi:FkbM family methyltransferase
MLEEVEVSIQRFDAVVNKFDRPSLAKIDVQGAELMVLQGMGDRRGSWLRLPTLQSAAILWMRSSTIPTRRPARC